MYLMLAQSTSQEQIFQDQYIYIGFHSELQDISFTILIKQMESRENLNKLKLEQHQKERQELLANIEKVIKQDSYYNDMLHLKSEQRAFIQKHRDFLDQNGYGIYYPDEERDAQKFEDHKQRLQHGSSKKEFMDA